MSIPKNSYHACIIDFHGFVESTKFICLLFLRFKLKLHCTKLKLLVCKLVSPNHQSAMLTKIIVPFTAFKEQYELTNLFSIRDTVLGG